MTAPATTPRELAMTASSRSWARTVRGLAPWSMRSLSMRRSRAGPSRAASSPTIASAADSAAAAISVPSTARATGASRSPRSIVWRYWA